MLEEEEGYKAVLSFAFKTVVTISIAVVFIMWGHSCSLNKDIIQECKSSCSGSDSQMRSVTTRECVCEEKSSNNWVIPRK
tara:strand:+ start:4047 stop:4286 length:240 start_codon:yes stop_codon:yes gene_type:complete